MLRIEIVPDGQDTAILLTGRLQSDYITELRRYMDSANQWIVLDLGEVTLIDRDVVKFLCNCEEEGIALRNCPPFIQEWILRERAEGE